MTTVLLSHFFDQLLPSRFYRQEKNWDDAEMSYMEMDRTWKCWGGFTFHLPEKNDHAGLFIIIVLKKCGFFLTVFCFKPLRKNSSRVEFFVFVLFGCFHLWGN